MGADKPYKDTIGNTPDHITALTDAVEDLWSSIEAQQEMKQTPPRVRDLVRTYKALVRAYKEAQGIRPDSYAADKKTGHGQR